MTPLERLELARRACATWKRDRDFDDLVSEAVIATLDCDEPKLLRHRMRCRAIDWLRVRDGRRFQHDPLPLLRWRATPDAERAELVVADDREALIVDRLLAGWTKRQVAGELGVDPSRVTQLLRRIRERNQQPDREV